MEKKKVIDCDNMIIIEHFEEKDTQKVIEKYEADPEWEEVLTINYFFLFHFLTV